MKVVKHIKSILAAMLVCASMATTLAQNTEKEVIIIEEATANEEKPFLGVWLNGHGLVVSKSIEGTAAHTMQLQENDEIVAINDTEVSNVHELREALAKVGVGNLVNVRYKRNNAVQSATAVLTVKPSVMQQEAEQEIIITEIPGGDIEEHRYINGGKKACCSSATKAKNTPFLGVKGIAKNQAGKGVVIEEVMAGSTAAEAGLQAGDIVLKINKVAVNNYNLLKGAIADNTIGDKVNIQYTRNGKKRKAKAILQAHKAASCCSNNCNNRTKGKNMLEESDNIQQERIIIVDEDMNIDVEAIIEDIKENLGDIDAAQIETQIREQLGGIDADVNIIIKELNNELQDIEIDVETIINEVRQELEEIKWLENEEDNVNNEQQRKRIIIINDEDIDFDADENMEVNVFTDKNGKSKTIIIADIDVNDMDMLAEVTEQGETKELAKRPTDMDITELNFYPNPSNGMFRLSFTATENTSLNIRIVDATGKQVFTDLLDNFTGEYNRSIDISDNPQGLYLLQLIQDDMQYVKKIIIQ